MSITFSFVGNDSTLSQSYYPPIELDEQKEYSLALVSLFTYNTIPNIDTGCNKFYYRTSKDMDDPLGAKVIELPTGSYEIRDIESYIQKQMAADGDTESVDKAVADRHFTLQNSDSPLPNLIMRANSNTLKIEMLSSYAIDFTPADSIARLLGFSAQLLNEGKMVCSDLPVDIISVSSIRVECSLTSGAYYDGQLSHTIYEFSPNVEPGFAIYIEPQNVCYLPINVRKSIDNITLRLISQSGELVNFQGEKILIRLELKQR